MFLLVITLKLLYEKIYTVLWSSIDNDTLREWMKWVTWLINCKLKQLVLGNMSLVDIILELSSHLSSFLLFFRRLKKKKLIRAEVGYLLLCFQIMLIEITSADCRLSSVIFRSSSLSLYRIWFLIIIILLVICLCCMRLVNLLLSRSFSSLAYSAPLSNLLSTFCFSSRLVERRKKLGLIVLTVLWCRKTWVELTRPTRVHLLELRPCRL